MIGFNKCQKRINNQNGRKLYDIIKDRRKNVPMVLFKAITSKTLY